jgi:phage gp36-like protein
MAFILESDVQAMIYADELDVLTQAIEDHFNTAERSTVDYFKGYLRSRYDVDELFADYDGMGEDTRPAALVTYMCDHLLCILYATQPDRMIPENRQQRCDKAEEWLEKISSGMIDPGFPTIDSDEETDINNPIQWNSNKKVSSTW